MVIKTISLLQEELNSLNKGKTIELFETEDLDLRIKIIGIKSSLQPDMQQLFNRIKKMDGKRFNKMMDILNRYDNEEYWDDDIEEWS